MNEHALGHYKYMKRTYYDSSHYLILYNVLLYSVIAGNTIHFLNIQHAHTCLFFYSLPLLNGVGFLLDLVGIGVAVGYEAPP